MKKPTATKADLKPIKDYNGYPFMNFSPDSMEGEEWKDMPQFDGCYSISNYGRVWAASRPIHTIKGSTYYTKERIRKQSITKFYNAHAKVYSEQLSINLRYEQKSYCFVVSRLVHELFVGPLHTNEEAQWVIHKDGDNCNNRFDNLELVNGPGRYGHSLAMKRVPRSGRKINKGAVPESSKNAPRPVVQYALDGEKLNEYDSIEAAAVANNTTRDGVRKVVQQKLVQLHGFVYRYKHMPYNGEHSDFSYEKQITQYTLDGKKIKTYPSVKAAALSVETDPNTLSRCATQKSLTCCGFVWRYVGETYDGAYKGRIKNKALGIVQYRLDGRKMARFVSANEAARITGYSAATLLDCAHKRSKVAHGYVWRFDKDRYSGEHRHFRKGKPVTQYTLDGKKINSYPSIEAAARDTGLTPDNIQKNVNGHNKTAGGFVWIYVPPEEIEEIPFVPLKYTKSGSCDKEVIQYSLEGKKLNVFVSISEAAKASNISVTGISSTLNKPGRTAGGFVWRTKGNRYQGSVAKNPPANRPRTVTQYDLNGKKLRVYKSAREAQRITGASSSTIVRVVNGRFKSTGGFLWRSGDGPEQIDVVAHYASSEAHIRSVSKPVLKYSLEGEFIAEYPSIRAAGRAEGINGNRITSVINGQTKSAGGNLWKLKDDYQSQI